MRNFAARVWKSARNRIVVTFLLRREFVRS